MQSVKENNLNTTINDIFVHASHYNRVNWHKSCANSTVKHQTLGLRTVNSNNVYLPCRDLNPCALNFINVWICFWSLSCPAVLQLSDISLQAQHCHTKTRLFMLRAHQDYLSSVNFLFWFYWYILVHYVYTEEIENHWLLNKNKSSKLCTWHTHDNRNS